jgi:lipopolysaccharide transport system permease protein
MTRHLSELYQHRELLWQWTNREIKIRYKQSLLGAAWAIVQPVALMLVFTVVFALFAHVSTGDTPYPLFSYTGLVIWTFVATSISFASASLVSNQNLITKIYFPREILPIASIGAALVDFLVAGLLLLGVLAWYRAPVTPALLWLPVLLLVQVLLVVGIALPAAALSVFIRDVRYVIPLGLQLWLYATPVAYPTTLVPERFRLIYGLNPMVGLVDSYRRVFILGEAPRPESIMACALVSAALALLGYGFFKRAEVVFADRI